MPNIFRKAIADARLIGLSLSFVAAVAAIDFAGASDPSASAAGTVEQSVSAHVVLIENMSFTPSPLSIRLGDKVQFRNKDIVPHTATSVSEGIFDSGVLKSDESWTFTPVEEGELQYTCSLHPTMKAKIFVEKAVSLARSEPESN